MSLFDFDNPSVSPIILQIPLPFSIEDRKAYPWLNENLRYYSLETELGRGGYSVAYKGFPCDATGKRIDGEDGPVTVVAKIPNLRSGYTSGATDERLASMSRKSKEEWELTRRKLLPSKHANTIFDVGIAWTRKSPDSAIDEFPITIQLFLSDAVPLKQWLEGQRLRASVSLDLNGVEVDNWSGIANWDRWLELVTAIADALVDIHRRRVIHGDIWPPNVYIRNSEPTSVIFIDFGESFDVTPSGDPRLQAPHPYRAPERDRPEYVPTEQVDVYSFGKLMLYLATGKDIVIPSGNRGEPLYYGHERRTFLRDQLIERNKQLLKARPELLDLISQCTELDPVCRPSMIEVRDQLLALSAKRPSSSIPVLSDRLTQLSANISAIRPSNIFLGFIERKVSEVERLLETVETEMVEITGTRDVLIAALVSLFGELGDRDSWTTLTTPAVWQANALGLDGRYATATIKALRRKASVQRVYAFSVEELGSAWTRLFIAKLRASGNPTLVALGNAIEPELFRFEFDKASGLARNIDAQFTVDHRQRLKLVIESLVQMIEVSELHKYLWKGKECQIEHMSGLYLGLKPVAKLADIQRLRSKVPLSVMHLSRKSHREEKWLLVMTDVRGRNETERYEGSDTSITGGPPSAPQLRKVRVFQSILGLPKNHILVLEDLMSSSLNVTEILGELSACIPSAILSEEDED